jgi:predicted DNA-binding protein
MPAGQPTSLRLPEKTIEQMKALEDAMSMKRTAIVIEAVRRMYRQEIGPAKAPPKKSRKGT